MLQHLDDPLPLPSASPQQRHAVSVRGRSLRRQRRAALLGVPVAAAVVLVSAVWVLAAAPSPSGSGTLAQEAPPPPLLSLDASARTSPPAVGECAEPVGDAQGEPDVTLFSLDRPDHPFVHVHWEVGTLPAAQLVELRFDASSADGSRSRQLVARTVDGEVVEQFVRDPRTGARSEAPPDVEVVPGSSMAAGFPRASLSGLGAGWTWTGSLSIDGALLDACVAEPHQR